MNGAQVHLAVNHVPVILCFTAFAVLIWGWLRKNGEIEKVGLVLLVAAAVFSIPAYFTGEPAEDTLKKFPGFTQELVHAHEESAEQSLVLSIASGIVAILAMYLKKKKAKYWRYPLTISILLSFVTSLLFLQAAHLGGRVRHEEIRTEIKPS